MQAYYTSVAAAIIVYDITNRESFEHIKEWLEGFREKNHKLCDIPILVVGNYPDKKKLRLVRKHELETFGELYNTMIAEVDSFEMTYLQNIFQPLLNKLTNTFVMTDKYNPGIKRLTRKFVLPKTNRTLNPMHTDIPQKTEERSKNKECIIS